jgi:hypothetical protein
MTIGLCDRLTELEGTVAIDGANFGGKIRQANRKEDRTDRRAADQTANRLLALFSLRASLIGSR